MVLAQDPGPDKAQSNKKITTKTTTVKKKKRPIRKLLKIKMTKSATIWFGHIGAYMATEVCWNYTISNNYLK